MTFTLNQKIGAGILALLALLFATKRQKVPKGSVDIGTPTVIGSGADALGGTDYGVTPPPPTESDIDRLIRESNAFGDTAYRDGQLGLVSGE